MGEKGKEEKENLLKLWNQTKNDQERRVFLLNLLDGAQPSHEYDPIKRILQLKILDPAMGSGHFLVEATDFLARELLKALSGEPFEKHPEEMVVREPTEHYHLKEPEEEDIRWARREVVERCIFGVDLNPMAVELAKLSLWLYTVAKNRPLNFLDHHLRCGDSLIGAKIDDLASLPELKKKKAEVGSVQLGLFESIFKEKVKILLGAFAQIEMLPSDTVEQIREKEELYQNFRKIVSRFQDVADVWISIYFGNDLDFANYQKLQNRLRSTNEEWERLSSEEWFKKAKEISNEKRFFHWDLEFPEIFFEGHQRKESPGFDAVVGNPPYIDSEEMTNSLPELREYCVKLGYKTASGNWDIFCIFIEQGLTLTRQRGFFSMIVPNKLLAADYALDCQNLLGSFTLKYLRDYSRVKVFEISVYPIVIVVQKIIPSSHHNIRVEVMEDTESAYVPIRSYENQVDQEIFSKLPKGLWSPLVRKHFLILQNILGSSYPLSRYCSIVGAATVSEAYKFADVIEEITHYSISDDWVMLVNTGTIDRYELLWGFDSTAYIKKKYQKPAVRKTAVRGISEKRLKEANSEKVIIAGMTLRLECTYDKGFCLAGKSTVLAFSNELDLKFLTACINSNLLSFAYRELFESLSLQGGYLRIGPPQVERIPIRTIFFSTNKKERAMLVEEAKNHYKRYVDNGNSDTLLYFIGSRLAKEHQPDRDFVKKHNADPLNKGWQIPEGTLWEQSDVVHDILAFLAEQMIEMNKEKQAEIKGYLKWLEGQLKIQSDTEGKVGIETLTGKTQIKNYLGDYQRGEEHLSFKEFWRILEKNKVRIQANLKSRELYEDIRSEYEKSLSKLLPLKEKLRKTDRLIDQIVYKLYGLTDEEIKIVESSYESI